MDATLWFDPETGEAEQGNPDYDPPVATWKVIRQGNAISILARNAKDNVVLIASGTWSGKGIGQRQEIGETVTESQWGTLTNVISSVDRDEELGRVQRREPKRPLVEYTGPEGVIPGAEASRQPTELRADPGGERDGLSGWWIFGAGVVALIGFIISWKAQQPNDPMGKVITIALGLLAGGLLIYSIYGGATRCPSCHAWFKREHTGTDELGSSTATRNESVAVNDSAGKQIGTTTQSVTYEVTRYRYHYKCKTCSHRWSADSSSQRKV